MSIAELSEQEQIRRNSLAQLRELGIDPGETTEDGMFSVEMVNCPGSCALAPVMLVDGTYHNKLKLEDVPGIVERYRLADAEEGEAGND